MYTPPPPTTTKIWVAKFPMHSDQYIKLVKKVKHSFIDEIIDENLLCISKLFLSFNCVYTYKNNVYQIFCYYPLPIQIKHEQTYLPNSKRIYWDYQYFHFQQLMKWIPRHIVLNLFILNLFPLPVHLLKANLLKSIIN